MKKSRVSGDHTGARRSLSLSDTQSGKRCKWREGDIKVLVRFIVLKGHSDSWPAFRNSDMQPFWSEASIFVEQYTKVSRSAEACHKKVVQDLSKKFENLLKLLPYIICLDMKALICM